MQMTIQALQDELRIQRDLNQLFQQDSSGRPGEPCVAELTEENFQRLHAEHERQAKELFLLRKTLEEMELRIETQKQTLSARDESIKKLLEMLQSKGLSAKATEEDHERTRRLAEAEMHVHHLESLLEQKEKENSVLREVSGRAPTPPLRGWGVCSAALVGGDGFCGCLSGSPISVLVCSRVRWHWLVCMLAGELSGSFFPLLQTHCVTRRAQNFLYLFTEMQAMEPVIS